MRDRPAIRLGAGELARDLDQSHALLAPFARLRWARPGSGWYTRETVAAMSRKGYGCALGSVYPYDATIPSSAFAGRYILRNVRPGAVIVLHDGGGEGGAALEPSAPSFGYRVVALSELALADGGPPLHRGRTGGGPRPTSTTLPQRGSW